MCFFLFNYWRFWFICGTRPRLNSFFSNNNFAVTHPQFNMPKRRRQGPNRAWQTSRVDPTLEEWEISKSELLNECKNSEGSETIATCLEQIYLYPYRFWQILDGFSNLPTVEQNCILSADEVSALKHFTNNEAFSKKYRVYITDMQFNGFKVHLIDKFNRDISVHR